MQSNEHQFQVALRQQQRPTYGVNSGDSHSRRWEERQAIDGRGRALTLIESSLREGAQGEIDEGSHSSLPRQAWDQVFTDDDVSVIPSPYNLLESCSGDPFSTLPSDLPQSFLGQHVQLCKLHARLV